MTAAVENSNNPHIVAQLVEGRLVFEPAGENIDGVAQLAYLAAQLNDKRNLPSGIDPPNCMGYEMCPCVEIIKNAFFDFLRLLSLCARVGDYLPCVVLNKYSDRRPMERDLPSAWIPHGGYHHALRSIG